MAETYSRKVETYLKRLEERCRTLLARLNDSQLRDNQDIQKEYNALRWILDDFYKKPLDKD